MSPLTLDDYARSVITDRMRDAEHAALAAEARRALRITSRPSFAASARVRLADGLRFLAFRLDPHVVVGGEPRLAVLR